MKCTLVYRPFFSLENDQKRQMLAIFSILLYTDGFVGYIFDILGRFAKIPPPPPSRFNANPSPKSCQKVEKKRILREESGKKIEKSAKMARFGGPKKAISIG